MRKEKRLPFAGYEKREDKESDKNYMQEDYYKVCHQYTVFVLLPFSR